MRLNSYSGWSVTKRAQASRATCHKILDLKMQFSKINCYLEFPQIYGRKPISNKILTYFFKYICIFSTNVKHIIRQIIALVYEI